MSDAKAISVNRWYYGGCAVFVVCGIGMIFTGPAGWVVLGTCAGAG